MGHPNSKKAPNKYYRHARISEQTFRQLVLYFALDLTASEAALLLGLTRKTVTTIFLKIRRRMAQECERGSPFSGHKLNGNGSGSLNGHGHTIVFGLFKRDGKIHTEIVPESERIILRAVITGRLAPETVTSSEGWRGYAVVVDVERAKPLVLECGQNGSPKGDTALADEFLNFWSFAESRMRKFHGIPPRTFYLHLKECEWRFNNRSKKTYHALLKLLRERPL